MDHPYLAPVKEFAAKRRAEEMGAYPILPPPATAVEAADADPAAAEVASKESVPVAGAGIRT